MTTLEKEGSQPEEKEEAWNISHFWKEKKLRQWKKIRWLSEYEKLPNLNEIWIYKGKIFSFILIFLRKRVAFCPPREIIFRLVCIFCLSLSSNAMIVSRETFPIWRPASASKIWCNKDTHKNYQKNLPRFFLLFCYLPKFNFAAYNNNNFVSPPCTFFLKCVL